MRKIGLFWIVGCIFFISLGGSCSKKSSLSSSSSWFAENGKLKVLSTTPMIDALVGDIGGDLIDHIPLVKGEMDPHSYDLVKGDQEKIARAGLIVANGLGLEHGVSLGYQLKMHPHVLFLGDAVYKKSPEKILHLGKEIDPHIWMDISLWAEAIDFLVEMFSSLDPSFANTYKENGKRVQTGLLEAHENLQKKMEEIPSSLRYLVTSHDAFRYFTKAYLGMGEENWEERCIAPEGLAPEGQLSVQDIRRVVDHLCAYQIKVVFPEANVSKDALNKIISACASRGLNVRISKEPLFGDSMGKEGSLAGKYPGMIEYDAEILKKEWEKE